MGTGTHEWDGYEPMSRMSDLDCDRQAGYARRLRRVEISAALLVDWFGEYHKNPGWRVVENGWPADTKVVNTCMSLNQMGVILTIESDCFEPIREGDMIPLGPSAVMETWRR